MKTILQFAFGALAGLDRATLRRIWDTIERLVGNFEKLKFASGSPTSADKHAYVLERVAPMIPQKNREVGGQIIRAIIEIVLISIRLKGVAK
jgi:hypothetical protein